MSLDYSTRESFTVRQPAVANLMVDSANRNTTVYPSPLNFQITKPQALANGFFTRIGVTEVVVDWCAPNIVDEDTQSLIALDISGIAPNTYSNVEEINLPTGAYTVKQAIDSFTALFNDLSGTTGSHVVFVPPALGQNGYLQFSGAYVNPVGTLLGARLGFIPVDLSPPNPEGYVSRIEINCPDLRPTSYLDIVSNRLTAVQNVKDNSTGDDTQNRNVLVRFYFDWDQEPTYDAYGYPILMGYRQFGLRRIFNPPKQIRWESNLPIGNLDFQVYNNKGGILTTPPDGWDNYTNWRMTLQLSEN